MLFGRELFDSARLSADCERLKGFCKHPESGII